MSEAKLDSNPEALQEMAQDDLLGSILSGYNDNQQVRVKDELKEYIEAVTRGTTVASSASKDNRCPDSSDRFPVICPAG